MASDPTGWHRPPRSESRLISRLARLAAGPFGPTRLAVALGLVSVPVVLISLSAYVPGPSAFTDISELERLSPIAPAVLAAEVPAVLVASVVGGAIGGWLVRRGLVLGAGITCALAWIVAIAVLPIGPTLVGLRYGTAYLAMSGTLEIRSTEGPLGSMGVGVFLSPLLAPVPFITLLIGVVLWARAIRVRPGSASSEDHLSGLSARLPPGGN